MDYFVALGFARAPGKQTCSSDTLNLNPDGIGERPQNMQDRVFKATEAATAMPISPS